MITKKQVKTEYKKNKSQIKTDAKLKKRQARQAYLSGMTEYYAQVDKPDVINPPKRSILEEIGNAVTHGVGAIFAIVALILMLIASNTAREYVSACVYSFGLIILFTASCLYHSFRHGSTVKRLFRRFDYLSIYLLIGATFAPILLCYVGGIFGLVFFIVQWLVIATGVTFIGVFGPSKLKPLHLTLYFVIGWSGLMFIPQMLTDNLGLFFFILGGGIIYSLGIIPFLMKKSVAHFIWHFFVLAGAIVQWLGIYLYIYLI